VQYHRKRRELRDFTSELTAIPGVGEKRKTRLLRNLGSIQRVANASVAELSPFVGRKTAEEISEHFRRQRALAEGGSDEPRAGTQLEETARAASEDDALSDGDGALDSMNIETRLDDPEGEAEDLQPIRSVDHAGNVRTRPRRTRKRGERSTNPHAVKREKLSASESSTENEEPSVETTEDASAATLE
jgi:hypothetical protein